MTLPAVLARDVALDRTIDALVARVTEETGRLVRAWTKTLPAHLPVATDPAALAVARRLDADWHTLGWDRILARTFDARVLRLVPLGLADGRAQVPPTAAAYLDAKRAGLEAEARRMLVDVAGIVRTAAATRQDVGEIVVEVRERADAFVTLVQTWLDSAASEVVQVVIGADAPEARVFLYSGPIDTRIRRWCLRRVARVYRRPTIDRMDNGQLPNTFVTRGGWNCRHLWRPVDAPALVALADTGRPLPEVAATLAAVAAALPRGRRPRRLLT
jgi:hypothetical protein